MNSNDFIIKTGKHQFFIYGYAQTGSASLTFPEDFDFVGIVDDESEAKSIVDRLNLEVLKEEGIELDEDLDDDVEAIEEALSGSDAYRYSYEKVDCIRKDLLA